MMEELSINWEQLSIHLRAPITSHSQLLTFFRGGPETDSVESAYLHQTTNDYYSFLIELHAPLKPALTQTITPISSNTLCTRSPWIANELFIELLNVATVLWAGLIQTLPYTIKGPLGLISLLGPNDKPKSSPDVIDLLTCLSDEFIPNSLFGDLVKFFGGETKPEFLSYQERKLILKLVFRTEEYLAKLGVWAEVLT